MRARALRIAATRGPQKKFWGARSESPPGWGGWPDVALRPAFRPVAQRLWDLALVPHFGELAAPAMLDIIRTGPRDAVLLHVPLKLVVERPQGPASRAASISP